MKRRDFLRYSMTSMSFAPMLALGQTRPCPVPEIRAGSNVVNTACQGTELELTAAALAPGQASASLGDSGLGSDALFTIQWANRFYYDHAKGRAHLIGKEASSQGSQRSNCLYDATSNRWHYDIYGGDENGHIYESFGYDPVAGQVYTARNSSGPAPIQFWTYGDDYDDWSTTSTPPWALSPNSTQAVLCWHPNLFGAGDGGLVVIRDVSGSDVELATWRKSSNSWGELRNGVDSTQHGAMTWVRSEGRLMVTHGSHDTFTIGTGSGGQPADPVRVDDTPIACRHAGSGQNVGILIDDPAGAGGPYILEKGGSNRVWKYQGGSWSLRNYTHPLPEGSISDATSWVVASVYPLGVFWARSNSSSNPSWIWRPED